MTLGADLAATAQTLIHKPVSEVFDAIVNPDHRCEGLAGASRADQRSGGPCRGLVPAAVLTADPERRDLID